MRTVISLLVAVGFALTVASCASFWTAHPSPKSIPVQMGVAGTNDLATAAELQLLRTANSALNFTPSREPIDFALASVITLVSGLGGWLARHKSTLPPK